jgi:hypothetical protein
MPDKILVDAKALKQILEALMGPHHLVLELQATRNIPKELVSTENPINVLIRNFNEALTS